MVDLGSMPVFIFFTGGKSGSSSDFSICVVSGTKIYATKCLILDFRINFMD